MTQEEQATADAAAAKAKADAEAAANATKMRTYSDEEFKKVVAERQEAKEKLRLLEEEKRKAADEKAKAEGKTAELLERSEKELSAIKAERDTLTADVAKYREKQEALKKSLLEKITDADLRTVGEKLDVDALAILVDKSIKKIEPSGKHQIGKDNGEFISRAQAAAMSQEEMRVNLDKVNKSMPQW
jgi:colicin import membrane protein